MTTRIEKAQAVDDRLLDRGLTDAQRKHLAGWCAFGDGARYLADVGSHSVMVKPPSWAGIDPWPLALGDTTDANARCRVSRSAIVGLAGDCRAADSWTPLLVASFVWGQGTTGYGPSRLRAVLRHRHVEAAPRRAVTATVKDGPRQGYRTLRIDGVRGLGPAFFTKFLYFAAGLPTGAGASVVDGEIRPLILDRKVAQSMRAVAEAVAWDETSLPRAEAARLVRWQWSDGGWTSARYDVYLRWAHQAAAQLSAHLRLDGRTEPQRPDLIELALFRGAVSREAG